MKNRILTLAAALAAIGTAQADTILISPTIRNGGFEVVNGVAATQKIIDWDTDPNGDVDNWTYWMGDQDLDNGIEYRSTSYRGFFQPGGSAYNLTGHIAQVGDVFTFDWIKRNRHIQGGLVWSDGAATPTITFVAGSGTATSTGSDSNGDTISGSYTVLATDPFVGKEIGFGASNVGSWAAIDDVNLSVEPISEPSAAALLITDIDYDAGDDTVRITWRSEPGKEYTVRWSPDLVDWGGDLDDDIPSQGDSTTYPPLAEPAKPNPASGEDGPAARVFFRVEEN